MATHENVTYDQQAAEQSAQPTMRIEPENTALVVTDPQIDFLSPAGVVWGLVGKSIEANHTVEHMTDHGWKFEGYLEAAMHQMGMFDRKGSLTLEGFLGSGADWMEQYKPYIEDGQTVIVSPHKVYGPETNDLVLQLRKRGIGRVILAGMAANVCIESHMRELLEQGFEVAVVQDATAAPQVPDGDGYQAALVNFRFLANAVWTTEEVMKALATMRSVEPAIAR